MGLAAGDRRAEQLEKPRGGFVGRLMLALRGGCFLQRDVGGVLEFLREFGPDGPDLARKRKKEPKGKSQGCADIDRAPVQPGPRTPGPLDLRAERPPPPLVL